MNLRTLIVFIIIVVVVAVFGMYAGNSFTKRQKTSERDQFVKFNKRFNRWWNFSLSKHTFRKLYAQLGNLSVYNYMELHIVSVKFFERSMLFSIALFIIGCIGFQDIVSGLIILAFSLVYMTSSINAKIDTINYNTYKAMSSLLGNIRETYTRLQSIPETLNECACPTILQIQLEKIYLICTANNGQRRLQEFYDECPNRTMRTLATTCFIRNDAGDDKVEGSPFKDAIGLIKDEVDAETRRLMRMRLMFKGLTKLPFVPIFIYPIGVIAFGMLLPATQGVFESAIGYVIKLIILMSSFICYYILSSMNNASAANVDDRLDFIAWLLRHNSIHTFAKTLVPHNYRRRRKLEEDLSGCLSSKDIVYLSFERYLFGTVFLVVSIVITIVVVFLSKINVYNSTTALTMSSTTTLTEEENKNLLELDAGFLASETPPDDTEGQVTAALRSVLPRATDLELGNQVTRIIDKYNTYHNLHFYWWFSLVGIGFALLGYFVPVLLLRLRISMVNEEAMIDVLQLQTVIAILMDTPLDTLSVIYWLMKSSDIHKNILIDCYNEYTIDPIRAIRDLRDKVTIAEFVQICDKLQTTVYQISLHEAFEDLVKDREGVLKIREMVQTDTLERKRRRASPVATAPMTIWMFVGFVLPVVWVAIKSATSVLSQINF